MYINFQQKRVSRSVKTMLSNIFTKNCKLHKFATTNSSFKKNRLFESCGIVKGTRISFFIKLGLVDQSKPCTEINSQKNHKLHKFATTNSKFF